MALKKCKECGHKVSTKADKCPNCGVKDPTTGAIKKVLSVIIALFLLGWFCSYLGDMGGESDPDAWKDSPNKIEAHVMVQGFVEDRLRSPSTAEFASSWDGYDHDESINYEGKHTYHIRSYVDSENAMGGTIRTHFTARIKQVSEEEWQLIELNLDD